MIVRELIKPVVRVVPHVAVRCRPWMLHGALFLSCVEVVALCSHPFQHWIGEGLGHTFAVVAAFLAHAADHLPKHVVAAAEAVAADVAEELNSRA